MQNAVNKIKLHENKTIQIFDFTLSSFTLLHD